MSSSHNNNNFNPKTRLMLHHVSKDRNLETLLSLSSNFFHLDEVALVGRRKTEKHNQQLQQQEKDEHRNDDNQQFVVDSNDTTTTKVKTYKYFREALTDCHLLHEDENVEKDIKKVHQKDKRHILVGIEIEPNAVPANQLRQTIQSKYPNCESVTFLPGNEGEGLMDHEKEHCDLFVFVQQFFRVQNDNNQEEAEDGAGGAGSLNVATSVAVTLSQFFEPSPSTSTNSNTNNNQNLMMIPVLPFSSDIEKSRRVHFLVRPCTAFGSNFVAIVSPSQRVLMGDKGNRSSFGKNMSSEVHCPIESYSSVYQALRDIRERTTIMMNSGSNEDKTVKVTVIGIELEFGKNGSDDASSSSFTNQLERFQQAFISSSSTMMIHSLAFVFASPHFNHGKLSESEKKYCDVVLTLNSRLILGLMIEKNSQNESDSNQTQEEVPNLVPPMNLPCLVSVVLHRLCLFFGFREGHNDEKDQNKFTVTLRSKQSQATSSSSSGQRQEKKKAVAENTSLLHADNDDDDNLLGGMM